MSKRLLSTKTTETYVQEKVGEFEVKMQNKFYEQILQVEVKKETLWKHENSIKQNVAKFADSFEQTTEQPQQQSKAKQQFDFSKISKVKLPPI